MLNDFLSLVFPKVCSACGKSLFKSEDCICAYCQYHLPKTNFHAAVNNPIEKLFIGRVAIQAASSLYLFNKGAKVQRLVHQLKYRGKKEIGLSLGKYYGRDLKVSREFVSTDLVIPVPLHPGKLKKRGYNQSEYFAHGIASSMQISCRVNALTRVEASETQTNKSRFQRWKNVEGAFTVIDPKSIEDKHILLVDDVITTGSTMEACANAILEVPGTRVSVVTIACTLF